jgi:hypothetical protein
VCFPECPVLNATDTLPIRQTPEMLSAASSTKELVRRPITWLMTSPTQFVVQHTRSSGFTFLNILKCIFSMVFSRCN